MKILVGCEKYQRVTIAFRNRGHEAFSCDTEKTSGNYPEWHIQENVLKILNDGWDMLVGFPPCTYLANPGLHYLKTKPGRKKLLKQAFDFFLKLYNADIPRICLENPVGWLNSHFRKPDQIIQPYFFGDPEIKTTCLWLRNLPKLKYKKVNKPKSKGFCIKKNGRKYNYF
ncbi:MAG: hypothetical protein GY870_14940, partial [archaeon]|nr:hypothetical protein [archaeon]